MNEKAHEILAELSQILTIQYDYPPNGEGSLGYKGNNIYRFKNDDVSTILQLIEKRADHYKHSYNSQVLAQEIITDLLDDGLITYGGYAYRKQQKETHSI